jgi:hypothetical protein
MAARIGMARIQGREKSKFNEHPLGISSTLLSSMFRNTDEATNLFRIDRMIVLTSLSFVFLGFF